MDSSGVEDTAKVGTPPGGGTVGGGLATADSPLGHVITFLGTILGDAEALTKDSASLPIGAIYHGLSSHVGSFVRFLTGHPDHIWETITELSVGQFYSDMLRLGLGVDTDQFDDAAKAGITTTDTMLGFAYIMPIIVAAASLAGKIPLAGRWIEAGLQPIAKLPEEMGLSWALGAQIEMAYEAAVGESVLEGIRRQKRGNRLEWPIIRTLLRQHAISHADFIDLMRNQGFPENQIEMIQSLDRTQLAVGDLQRLWQYGELDRVGFRDSLRTLGYVEGDVNHLTTLYIDRAESMAGTMLRSSARGLALAQLITLEQYQGILESTHVPEKEWKDDLAAIRLEIEHGHTQTSITNLKNLYLRGHLPVSQLAAELHTLGYTAEAVRDTIAAWDAGPAPRPLTQAKILSYFLSGALSRDQAQARLLEAGTRVQDVGFVLDHAADVPKARPHRLTPALVIQGFLDGAIKPGDLTGALERAGATGEVGKYYEETAYFKQARQKRPAGATIPLSMAEIVEAWYYGLVDVHAALGELEHLGYSADDALIILEIKNKGPISFAPQPKPLFGSVGEAEAFLLSQGYTVKPPPDPRIAAAEGLLWQYGFVILPPVTPATGAGTDTGGSTGDGGRLR